MCFVVGVAAGIGLGVVGRLVAVARIRAQRRRRVRSLSHAQRISEHHERI